ncbi:MAG: AraC family transcriptional regulator [Planctomycetota bacterium]
MPNFDLNRGSIPAYFSTAVMDARRFVLPSDRRPTKLTVVSGGVERCGRQYGVDRDTFDLVGLEFVAAGAVEVVLGAGPVRRLGPGSVFTYGPGVAQRIRTAGEGPAVKYFVDCAVRGATKRLADAGLPMGTIGETRLPERAVALLDEIVHAGVDGGSSAIALCTALVDALLHLLADSTHAVEGDVSPRHRQAFATYRRLRAMIDEHALEVRGLAELAGRCGITTAYACRVFRQFERETPHVRLLRTRMGWAAGMLRGGALVKDVAVTLGYDDAGHFSRAFKRVYGIPPSAVRLQT